jgi:hypothetical protein
MGLVKTVVILILLAVVIALILWLLHVEPVFSWINPLVDSALHLDFSGVTAQMAAGYAAIVATVGGALGTAYKWIKTRTELFKTQKAAAENAIQSNAQISELATLSEQKDAAITAVTTEKDTLLAKVTEYESTFSNYKTVLDGKEGEIERLRSQIDGLSKMNVDKLADNVAKKVEEAQRIT